MENNQEKTILDNNKTIISAGTDATQLGASAKCPICGTENTLSEKYCGDCGFLLSSTPGDDTGSNTDDIPRLMDVSETQEYFIKNGENTVGREASDIQLNDPTVSRRHAKITYSDGKCYIEDAGSTNGTTVRGESVTSEIEIFDGDEIKFGSVALFLHLPESEAADSSENSIDDAEDEIEMDETSDEEDQVALAYLESVKNPDVKYQIYTGINTIGRKSSNDIQISDDPYLSGLHAEITSDEHWFEIVDVGSTNGTIVNGVKLDQDEPIQLDDGDQITFGRTQLIFVINQTNDDLLSDQE